MSKSSDKDRLIREIQLREARIATLERLLSLALPVAQAGIRWAEGRADGREVVRVEVDALSPEGRAAILGL